MPEEVAGVYYLQRFVRRPSSIWRDYRIFVCDGEVVAGMVREGDSWITNVHQGGRPHPWAVPAEAARLAVAAAAAVDVDYSGVDLIEDAEGRLLVLEVNSMPSWSGLQTVTDVRHRPDVVDALPRAARAGERQLRVRSDDRSRPRASREGLCARLPRRAAWRSSPATSTCLRGGAPHERRADFQSQRRCVRRFRSPQPGATIGRAHPRGHPRQRAPGRLEHQSRHRSPVRADRGRGRDGRDPSARPRRHSGSPRHRRCRRTRSRRYGSPIPAASAAAETHDVAEPPHVDLRGGNGRGGRIVTASHGPM